MIRLIKLKAFLGGWLTDSQGTEATLNRLDAELTLPSGTMKSWTTGRILPPAQILPRLAKAMFFAEMPLFEKAKLESMRLLLLIELFRKVDSGKRQKVLEEIEEIARDNTTTIRLARGNCQEAAEAVSMAAS